LQDLSVSPGTVLQDWAEGSMRHLKATDGQPCEIEIGDLISIGPAFRLKVEEVSGPETQVFTFLPGDSDD
jgi:hypothetical protein